MALAALPALASDKPGELVTPRVPLIVLIDRAANELKRGRYPQDAAASRLAAMTMPSPRRPPPTHTGRACKFGFNRSRF